MIIPSKFNGYNKDGTRNLFMGGGGGGPTQTTSTVQNTNIPAYAEPYVNTMLGATQKQLFNTSEVGGTPAVAAEFRVAPPKLVSFQLPSLSFSNPTSLS